MQSLSIWHDVSHPFHLEEEQCQRFEGIIHTPSVVPVLTIIPEFITQFSVDEPIETIAYAKKRLCEQRSIRAPPIFS